MISLGKVQQQSYNEEFDSFKEAPTFESSCYSPKTTIGATSQAPPLIAIPSLRSSLWGFPPEARASPSFLSPRLWLLAPRPQQQGSPVGPGEHSVALPVRPRVSVRKTERCLVNSAC
ncbi:Protein Fam71A [Manis pentadactyla]|nr:Protein Fam71A [Manis pentadactyla]